MSFSNRNALKFHKKNHKQRKLAFWRTGLLTLFLCMLFIPGYVSFSNSGTNVYHVFLNGIEVGICKDETLPERLLLEARRAVAKEAEGLVFLETSLSVTGEEMVYGSVDSEELILENMQNILGKDASQNLKQSYTVKINEYLINLASMEEVQMMLQAAVEKYAPGEGFKVSLSQDYSREFNVFGASVADREEHSGYRGSQNASQLLPKGGAIGFLSEEVNIEEKPLEEQSFEEVSLGIWDVDFAESIEVAEGYLPEEQLMSLSDAIEEVTKEQEKPSEYEVQSGDTLSEISLNVNIPIVDLVEMNKELLDDESSTIHIGDKLVITIPQPELSVERTERAYVEEIYDEAVIYVDRDDWYTNESKVVQQPSAGFRKAIVDIHYKNDREESREILKEEVLMEAVPKIVERGTKIPPTYIKPISGGRLSSGFGKRTAPKKGASTYHKGIDWATPTGTPVYASSGGTVEKAGWGSGYGYVVYIKHPDGKQTRYGHLSKVLVKAGQSVKQGEKIALSGNTGVSTGPHIHFEILVNGSQVNPLNYLN